MVLRTSAHLGLFAAIVLGAVTSLPAQDWTLERLAAAHQSTVELIQTADIRAKKEQSLKLGAEVSNQRHRWCRLGLRERHTSEYTVTFDNQPPSDGLVDIIVDFDKGEIKTLQATNREDLLRLHPLKQHSVRGAVEKLLPTEGIGHAQLMRYLYLRFSFEDTSPMLTLSELIRDYKDVSIVGETDIDGDPCIHLRCTYPATTLDGVDGATWDLFFSIQHGMWVRKGVQTIPGQTPTTRTHLLSDFKQVADGVHLPVTIALVTEIAGQPHSRVDFNLVQTTVNEPLDDAAVDFVFPKNLLVAVRDAPTSPDAQSVDLALIGDNGEVVRTFPKDTDQFKRFIEQVRENPDGYGVVYEEADVQLAASSNRWLYFAAAGAFVMGALLLAVRLSYHKRVKR